MEMNERIKKARKEAGYKSQEKLAELLGTTRNAVATYELGRVVPNDVFLQLMATKLHISYEWLKKGTGEMYEPAGSDLADILEDCLDSDDIEIIKIYASLPPEHRQILKTFTAKVAAA